jgi:hypothetical protein
MNAPSTPEAGQAVGPYRGMVAEVYRDPALLAALAELPERLGRPGATPLSFGSDPVHRLELPLGPAAIAVAVKRFAPQTAWKDFYDRRNESRAGRAWARAGVFRARGIGTPEPIGYLERWAGRRLVESFFIARYAAGLTSFRQELIRFYRHDPHCGRIMALLQYVADGVRQMHDAGLQHRDLGNQNILLRRTGEQEWADLQFVDLNRARVRDGSLSLPERAFDCSRIFLPSDFLRIFEEMYFQQRPPPAFQAAARRHRQLYGLRARTRRWRHPLRSRRRERHADESITYPPAKEIWIWDDRSAQPVNTLRRKERQKLYPWRNHLAVGWATASAALPVWRRYRALKERVFAEPVEMANRVGVAVEPNPETWAEERRWLAGLGTVPVLLRFYHHQPETRWDFLAGVAGDLRRAGHAVAVALVQDRWAVREPARWAQFVMTVLGRVHEIADWVEVGHAINRVKWGLRTFAEYARLMAPVAEAARRYPELKLMGPAAIDFEYYGLLAALRQLPAGIRFQALSHLLYVDRRGAPENRQGPFSTLEKILLARAIAGVAPASADRLIISEVNWPLIDGGIHSPIGSPYLYPGQPLAAPPSVTEDEYADYMIRYLLIAICSGLVERVYWWRLVSRGFGLVDDAAPGAWRARPAYHRLQQFLGKLSAATFLQREEVEPGQTRYRFRTPDGQVDWTCSR